MGWGRLVAVDVSALLNFMGTGCVLSVGGRQMKMVCRSCGLELYPENRCVCDVVEDDSDD